MKVIHALFILSFILFSSIPKMIKSQDYIPLPDSNAVWIVANTSSAGDFYYEYSIGSTPNDTIINSIKYTKIYITDALDYNFYAGAFRSDSGGKAFFVPPYVGYTDEHLWYDFNLVEGDTIRNVALNDMQPGLVGEYDFKVDSTQILSVGPYGLKCLYLTPVPPYPPFYTFNSLVWVEGIGSLNGGIYNMYMCGLSASSLRCIAKNDTIYYYTDFIDCEIFEEDEFIYNPGECKVPVGVIDKDALLFNETRIFSNTKGGILISNLLSGRNSIHVYNQIGSNVYTKSLMINNSNRELQITDLVTGFYIVIIDAGCNRMTRKIFVE